MKRWNFYLKLGTFLLSLFISLGLIISPAFARGMMKKMAALITQPPPQEMLPQQGNLPIGKDAIKTLPLLPSLDHVNDFGKQERTFLSKFLHKPKIFVHEIVATIEALISLGSIARFENIYYHIHLEYTPDGLGEWGAPFTKLLIEPNVSDTRRWDYRVESDTIRYKIIARRRGGKYKDREIWFDSDKKFSGNYPFWPWRWPFTGVLPIGGVSQEKESTPERGFPDIVKFGVKKQRAEKEVSSMVIKTYHASGNLKAVSTYKNSVLIRQEKYDEAGNPLL